MKRNDKVQVRAENVTTGEERRNSTCLGLSTAKQNHEQTHYKANNYWDVFQDPMHESDLHILQGWAIQCTALPKTISQEFICLFEHLIRYVATANTHTRLSYSRRPVEKQVLSD